MATPPIRERDALDDDTALEALTAGDLDIVGRMPWSSNATFLVEVDAGDVAVQAIYKPVRGERPLWDFPAGLHRRERASYVLSRLLGWDLVPPTVLRDGPLGDGSLQLVVPCDYQEHYFTLVEDDATHPVFQRLCVFDVLANSADRKSGHVLLGDDGGIYAIDNGLSFHEELKLRTVIWQWSGERLPAAILEDLDRLAEDEAAALDGELAALLDPDEHEALLHRLHRLLRDGCFPVDHTGHRYPWPLV